MAFANLAKNNGPRIVAAEQPCIDCRRFHPEVCFALRASNSQKFISPDKSPLLISVSDGGWTQRLRCSSVIFLCALCVSVVQTCDLTLRALSDSGQSLYN